MRNHCFARVINCDRSGGLLPIHTINFSLIIKAYMNKKLSLIAEGGEEHHLLCGIGGGDGSITVINFTELLTRFNI